MLLFLKTVVTSWSKNKIIAFIAEFKGVKILHETDSPFNSLIWPMHTAWGTYSFNEYWQLNTLVQPWALAVHYFGTVTEATAQDKRNLCTKIDTQSLQHHCPRGWSGSVYSYRKWFAIYQYCFSESLPKLYNSLLSMGRERPKKVLLLEGTLVLHCIKDIFLVT